MDLEGRRQVEQCYPIELCRISKCICRNTERIVRLIMIVTTVRKRNEKSKEEWSTNSLSDSIIASLSNMVKNGVDLQREVWETENDGEKEGTREGTERGQTTENTEEKSIRGRAIRLRSSAPPSSDNLYDFIITHSTTTKTKPCSSLYSLLPH